MIAKTFDRHLRHARLVAKYQLRIATRPAYIQAMAENCDRAANFSPDTALRFWTQFFLDG